jgi:hypothetical protein
MKLLKGFSIIILSLMAIHCRNSSSNNLFNYNPHSSPRWISFENKDGGTGKGAAENNGAKGHPCDYIPAHSSMELMNYTGGGIINRIWLTINDRSAYMCRSLVIKMYWDGDEKPAVSAPWDCFFGQGFERKKLLKMNSFQVVKAGPLFHLFLCRLNHMPG